MELDLPILWYSEEQHKLVDAGMEDDIDVNECKTKRAHFLQD
jgi:hypothetical protein